MAVAEPPPAGKMDGRYNCFDFLRSLIIYLCSPVKTRAVHSFTCLYGPAENVQNEATILTARRKYIKSTWRAVVCAPKSDFRCAMARERDRAPQTSRSDGTMANPSILDTSNTGRTKSIHLLLGY